jgi:heme-degrading monooxygenase HmoA
MFVKINEYLILENEERTFVEMIKLEQKMNAVPAGLDHYHLFKDKDKDRKYWLVEFWLKEEDYLNYQKLDSHKYFLDLLKGVLEIRHEQHFCEIVI